VFCHRYARTRPHHGVLLDPAALPAGLTKPAPEGQKKLMDMGLIPGEPTPAAQLARFVECRLSNGARSCTWPARRGSSNMTMPAGLPGARGVAIVSSNIEPQPAHRSPSSVRVARVSLHQSDHAHGTGVRTFNGEWHGHHREAVVADLRQVGHKLDQRKVAR
jgi:hypothetical protein